MEVSLLLLLPKVATAGKNVWMVNLLGSEVGSAFVSWESILYSLSFANAHSNPAV